MVKKPDIGRVFSSVRVDLELEDVDDKPPHVYSAPGANINALEVPRCTTKLHALYAEERFVSEQKEDSHCG